MADNEAHQKDKDGDADGHAQATSSIGVGSVKSRVDWGEGADRGRWLPRNRQVDWLLWRDGPSPHAAEPRTARPSVAVVGPPQAQGMPAHPMERYPAVLGFEKVLCFLGSAFGWCYFLFYFLGLRFSSEESPRVLLTGFKYMFTGLHHSARSARYILWFCPILLSLVNYTYIPQVLAVIRSQLYADLAVKELTLSMLLWCVGILVLGAYLLLNVFVALRDDPTLMFVHTSQGRLKVEWEELKETYQESFEEHCKDLLHCDFQKIRDNEGEVCRGFRRDSPLPRPGGAAGPGPCMRHPPAPPPPPRVW